MEETVVLSVTQGKLRGLKVKTEAGATYYSFRGIPYAKPPIGELRFKPPEPADHWKGTRDAIEIAPVAPQISVSQGTFEGTEDCLYINVFIPQLPTSDSQDLKPVLVYIHGGGYFMGSGNNEMHGPSRIMDAGEVVLVTMNYRLAALGFLSTGDSVVSGNNGLKDQVLALKWVQENITKFGGDPKNVTIAGISAGGSATHLHLFSPLSKGLFHKAISESGSAVAPWSAQDPDLARKRAFRLGETLGIKTESSQQLVEFLRTLPAKTIVEGTLKTLTEDERHPLPVFFIPVVERGDDPNTMFLSEKPLTLIRKKKFNEVPLITGVVSREGLIIARDLAANASWYESLNEDLEPVFNVHLGFEKGTSDSKELTRKIREYFFGNRHIPKETLEELTDMYGDIFFNIWTDMAAKEQAKVSDVPQYFYQFSYEGNNAHDIGVSGAFHGADMLYLFEVSLGPIVSKELHGEDKAISEKLIKMWINFAKTGNPTPQEDDLLGITWTPFTKTETNFMNIDKELKMQKDFLRDRMQFWENLLQDRSS